MTDWDAARRTVAREDAYAQASAWIGRSVVAALAASVWCVRAFPTQLDGIGRALVGCLILLMVIKAVWAIGYRPWISLEQYYDLRRRVVLQGYLQRLTRVQQHLTLDVSRIVFGYLDESDAELNQLQQAERNAR